MFQAAQVWRNQSQWHFLCCKLNFYFHIHLWFLQALKQDNKKNLFKCTIGFTFQSQSVQCSFAYQAASSVPTTILLSAWSRVPPVHCIMQKLLLRLQFVIHSAESLRPDRVKRTLAVHLIKAHYANVSWWLNKSFDNNLNQRHAEKLVFKTLIVVLGGVFWVFLWLLNLKPFFFITCWSVVFFLIIIIIIE